MRKLGRGTSGRFAPVREAFTLLEMVLVMVTLSVVMLIAVAILTAIMKIGHAASDNYRALVVQSSLADQFRDDVARANAAPATLGKESAGPDCLILRLGKDRHLLYRWQAGRLERSELGGSTQRKSTWPLGNERVKPEFVRSGSEPAVIGLRLVETRPHGSKQSVEFTAALGGDGR